MREMKDSGDEWLGHIPETWTTIKLKHCVKLRTEKTGHNTEAVPYIGLEHVSSNTGKLCDSYEEIIDFDGETLDFKSGDVLFGKLRPYLAKAFIAENNGRCSSEFWVMNPIGIYGRFLLYYILSNSFISNIDHSTFGVKMPRAEWEYACNERIPIPPHNEQLQIVNYLDKKCAEIDALIAAKEKANSLLKEQRRSIIYEATTKGLDPDAPMKDSGVEWIGKIPEEWKVTVLKRLGTVSTGATPSKNNSDFWDGTIPWVSSKDLKTDFIDDSEDHITEEAINETGLILQEPNTMIFCVRSGILRHTFPVAVTRKSVTINQDLRAINLSNKVDPVFLMFYLKGINNSIVSLYQKIGATVESIEMEWMAYLPVVLPDLDEQKKITAKLISSCSEIDSLILTNNSTINKLKEYRQSIIYEAVTGKVEI